MTEQLISFTEVNLFIIVEFPANPTLCVGSTLLIPLQVLLSLLGLLWGDY